MCISAYHLCFSLFFLYSLFSYILLLGCYYSNKNHKIFHALGKERDKQKPTKNECYFTRKKKR